MVPSCIRDRAGVRDRVRTLMKSLEPVNRFLASGGPKPPGLLMNRGLRPSARHQIIEQLFVPSIFRNDNIGAGPHQALALPDMDALTVDLIAGHSHGHATGALDLLNLDEAIAEAQ